MNNTILLTKISSVCDNFDPVLFLDLILNIKDLVANEKYKQELKEIMDELLQGLIKINYELEDERIEDEFIQLLDQLVIAGFDVGKVLIKEITSARNSEQQAKVIYMITSILKASSWIRKISLSQKLDPVIQTLISSSLPVRIKEILNKLYDSIKPYLKKNQKNKQNSSVSTLHHDKIVIIQEWIQFPKVKVGLESVFINEISILDFFGREVNFEILIDYILFSEVYGTKSLNAIRQLYPHFGAFKRFNPEKKIVECVYSALKSNNTEFAVRQSIKLLQSLISDLKFYVITHIIVNSSIQILIKNLKYPEVRSFLFTDIICNSTFPIEIQNSIKNKIIIDMFANFSDLLMTEEDKTPVLEMLYLIIPEILTDPYLPKADELEVKEGLNFHKYKKTILTTEGQHMIDCIFKITFNSFWTSSLPEMQEIQVLIGDLIVYIIRFSQEYKPLKGLLNKTINQEFLESLQANILNYSLNSYKEAFKLPCLLITRPVGTHMIQLARVFNESIRLNSELVKLVSTNCWSAIFLWFFVFKSNGMLLNILFQSISILIDQAEEKKIKEVLLDKNFLDRIIQTLTQKPDPEEKDFYYFCKRTGKKISEYLETHKTKFSKEISNTPGWKTLYPLTQENALKTRPSTMNSKKGHTFILGLDSLEKTQKNNNKGQYEIEHLSSQLDLIYKVKEPKRL